jgi:hypothetical protein
MKKRLIEELVTTVRTLRRRVWVDEPAPSSGPVIETQGVEVAVPKPAIAKCGRVLPFQRRRTA